MTRQFSRLGLGVLALAVASSAAHAQLRVFEAFLDGPSEAPPNASPGTGYARVTFDLGASTMNVQAAFSGLLGNTTAAHIHAPTAVAFTGTAGVVTQTPSFAGFPLGVTSGTMNTTFDLTLGSTYNAPFLALHGGNTAAAAATLLSHIEAGRAYFNVHTSSFGGGEIRGFLTAVPEPSTYALMATGLGVVGMVGWRRRRSA